jgi:hypothetical protein
MKENDLEGQPQNVSNQLPNGFPGAALGRVRVFLMHCMSLNVNLKISFRYFAVLYCSNNLDP